MRHWHRAMIFAALLVGLAAAAPAGEVKSLLLIGQSRDNHPVATHEYMAGIERLANWLTPTADLQLCVVKADEPWVDGPAMLDKADGALLFLSEGARWITTEPRRHQAFARLAARGGGLSALHWALGTRGAEPIEACLKLLGGCHGGPDRKYQVVDTELRMVATHPITAGIGAFAVRDEFYYRLKFPEPPSGVQPLVQATIDKEPQTVAWAYERGDGGRSFGFTGLHFDANWQLPQYQRLVRQAVKWTMKLPSDSPDEADRKPR
jgi:hypothetical protein